MARVVSIACQVSIRFSVGTVRPAGGGDSRRAVDQLMTMLRP